MIIRYHTSKPLSMASLLGWTPLPSAALRQAQCDTLMVTFLRGAT